jgi:hypothetical protein
MSAKQFSVPFLAGLASVAFLGTATVAHAVTFNGTVNIDVYQGTCISCDINAPEEQAQQGNPFIAPGKLIGSGSYTGDLNFSQGGTGTGNIATFLGSSGGTLAASLASLSIPMSSNPFGLTTVMVITGTTALSLTGAITHDDGMSLYDGVGFSNLVVGAPIPVVATPTNYTGLVGNWELIYVEANGLPAVLTFDVSRSDEIQPTPLPAAVWLMGTVLAGGAGFGSWRKRKARATA